MPLCPDCKAEAEVTRVGPETPRWVTFLGNLVPPWTTESAPKTTVTCDECDRCHRTTRSSQPSH